MLETCIDNAIVPFSLITGEPLIEGTDFAKFQYEMALNYGYGTKTYEFTNVKSYEYSLLLRVFEQCLKLGFSKKEFYSRLELIFRTNKFGLTNFQSTFFNGLERKEFKDRTWANKQFAIDPENRTNIVGFKIPNGDDYFIGYCFIEEAPHKCKLEVAYPEHGDAMQPRVIWKLRQNGKLADPEPETAKTNPELERAKAKTLQFMKLAGERLTIIEKLQTEQEKLKLEIKYLRGV